MFERFTENARRMISLARDEAMNSGSAHIQSEHILLGVLLADQNLGPRFGGDQISIDAIRKQIDSERARGVPILGPIEMPLSDESKRILLLASEEAQSMGHRRIALAHILLAILRVKECLAAKLLERWGVTDSAIRDALVREDGGLR